MQVAVIGSGPGGSIISRKLIDHGFDVTIFEKGKKIFQNEIEPYSKDELLKKYNGAGVTVAFGKQKIKFVEGSCLGGGSEINAGLYHRLPDYLFEKWSEKFGLKNFTIEELRKDFEETATAINVDFNSSKITPLSKKLALGAKKLNWKVVEVPRWIKTLDDGSEIRQSMTETYLNQKCLKNVVSEKIVKLKKHGNYWKVVTSSGLKKLYDKVFLCAGAIETPLLLQKSKLSKLAGNNLFMHPSLKVVAQFNESVNPLSRNVGVHQVKEFSPIISFGCSISTPEYLAIALKENGQDPTLLINNFNKMGVYYVMLNGGRGNILKIPLLNESLVRYEIGSHELDQLIQGVTNLSNLLFKSGAKKVYPGINGLGSLNSVEDLYKLFFTKNKKHLNLMTIHLMGSCPFGENTKLCVADSWGKVHGHDGLFIADSSLMNSGLGVNPQGTLMAIAHRVANKFISDNNISQ